MIVRAVLLAVAVTTSASAAHAQAPLDLSDSLVAESLTKKPRIDTTGIKSPKYPEPARRALQQGEVVVATCVDESGSVTSARVEKSSGFPILDDASIKWITSDAKFMPAEANGKPVAVCNYKFTYVWSLPNPSQATAPANDTSAYFSINELKTTERPFVRSQPKLPVYTKGALARKSEGVLHMSLCITPAGRLASITFHDSDFDSELMSLTSMWYGMSAYEPGKRDGKPVGVCDFEVEYEWKLPR